MQVTQSEEVLQHIENASKDVLQAIHAQSIPAKMLEVAHRYPTYPVFSGALDNSYSKWQTYTFLDLKNIAFEIAAGLMHLGIQKKDVVQVIASPRIEHHLIDYGILSSGAISCSLYRQLKAADIAYIESLTESPVLFVGKTSLLKEFLSIQTPTQVRHIIALEKDEAVNDDRIIAFQDFLALGKTYLSENPRCVDNTIAQLSHDDIAEVIFTSGTTGNPKGVMLSHSNILANSFATFNYFNLPHGLKQLSFLPLAHVFARNAEQYSPLFSLFHIYCVADLNDVKLALTQVKPDLFCAVPRLFEKIQKGLLLKVKESGKEKLIQFGLDMGHAVLESKIKLKRPNLFKNMLYKLYKKFIFSKILNALGLEKLQFVVTGGGAINPTLQKWFTVLGIDILQGYGLTETSPVVSTQIPKMAATSITKKLHIKLPKIQSFGSCGIPIAGTHIKIKEDGELAVKGPQVFQGYYKKPENTAEVFDEEGWFLTGDYGKISDFGEIIISGRKKEIIVTSGGKNVSPLKIENLLTGSKLISQAMVIGDEKPFLTALLCIDTEKEMEDWSALHGWEFNLEKLVKNPALIYEIETHVIACNEELQNFESIKRFILVADEWLPENGLLTPTMKMKRGHIKEKYKKEIQKLYSDNYVQSRLDLR